MAIIRFQSLLCQITLNILSLTNSTRRFTLFTFDLLFHSQMVICLLRSAGSKNEPTWLQMIAQATVQTKIIDDFSAANLKKVNGKVAMTDPKVNKKQSSTFPVPPVVPAR